MNNDHGRVSLLIFPTPDLDVDRLYIDRAWLPGAPWCLDVSGCRHVIGSKTQNTIAFCGVSLVKHKTPLHSVVCH